MFYTKKRSGDFECLSIREELIFLWRKRGSDLGGGPEGATRSLEQRAGRRSGAEGATWEEVRKESGGESEEEVWSGGEVAGDSGDSNRKC